MTKRRSAKWLVKAVLNGDWTFDAAIEEHLHENYRGPFDIPPYSQVNIALCYFNIGWQDRQLVLWGEPMTVGEIIKEFGLEAFLPLFDRTENARFQKGDLVTYEGEEYRVIGRREVSPSAGHGFDDFEVFIEPLNGDSTSGFVEENKDITAATAATRPSSLSRAWSASSEPSTCQAWAEKESRSCALTSSVLPPARRKERRFFTPTSASPIRRLYPTGQWEGESREAT